MAFSTNMLFAAINISTRIGVGGSDNRKISHQDYGFELC